MIFLRGRKPQRMASAGSCPTCRGLFFAHRPSNRPQNQVTQCGHKRLCSPAFYSSASLCPLSSLQSLGSSLTSSSTRPQNTTYSAQQNNRTELFFPFSNTTPIHTRGTFIVFFLTVYLSYSTRVTGTSDTIVTTRKQPLFVEGSEIRPYTRTQIKVDQSYAVKPHYFMRGHGTSHFLFLGEAESRPRVNGRPFVRPC